MKYLLTISGTGRNCGKTYTACTIIDKVKHLPCIAIKISPHFHSSQQEKPIWEEKNKYQIFRELNPYSEKDSTKMLKAGAWQVYYIQTTDLHIKEAFEKVMENIPENYPIICESGALSQFVKSGLHILLFNESQSKINQRNYDVAFKIKDIQKELTFLEFNHVNGWYLFR